MDKQNVDQDDVQNQAEERLLEGLYAEEQSDTLALDEIINDISEIEPEAGDDANGESNEETTENFVQDTYVFSNAIKPVGLFPELTLITGDNSTGPLDETNLDFAFSSRFLNLSNNNDSFAFNSSVSRARSLFTGLNNNDDGILQTPAGRTNAGQGGGEGNDAPLPPIAPDANILVSNATNNQRFINNNDHYSLDFTSFNKNVKVTGEDMDISGVSNNAEIRYKFKEDGFFRAHLKSNWNSVKNIEVESDDLDHVVVKNFVHADITLGTSENAKVRVIDAKRGNIETEDGNDVITIKALTNGSGWSNTFTIDSGAGNDRLNLRGDDGHTIFEAITGTGNDRVNMKNEYERSDINLGEGNDVFKGGIGVDTVHGGEGNDRIIGDKNTTEEVRLDEAILSEGQISIAYGGNDVRLTSMGIASDGSGQVLRLRNGSDEDIDFSLTAHGKGYSENFTMDAGTELFILAPHTHATYIAQLETGHKFTKASNGGQFSYGQLVEVEGEGSNDFLYGEAGNDKLFGRAGDDILIGGEGNDKLFGGSGLDIAIFEGSIDEYDLILKNNGKLKVKDQIEGRDGNDTLVDVDAVIFGADDFMADILAHYSAAQLENTFGAASPEEFELTDLLDYSPLQNAIDGFVQAAENGNAQSTQVEQHLSEFVIFTMEDIQQNHIIV